MLPGPSICIRIKVGRDEYGETGVASVYSATATAMPTAS
jgi:hypothetical protein